MLSLCDCDYIDFFYLLIFLESEANALQYLERKRPIPPRRYNYTRKKTPIKKKDKLIDDLDEKIDIIQHAQHTMKYLNERMGNNLGYETEDLSISDVEAYERAMSSGDEESHDDESDDEESDDENEGAGDIHIQATADLVTNNFQTDPILSGRYEYTEDVNIAQI